MTMGEQYFVLHGGEDGGTIHQLSEKELLERLKPEGEGETCCYYGNVDNFIADFSELREYDQFNYWPDNTLLIIKGEIVTPKPKEVVMEYEI